MKNLLILITVLISSVTILSGVSFSQTTGFIGTLGGGVSFPIKELQKNYNTGYDIGGKAGYLFNNNIASGLAIDFASFGYKHDSIVLSGGDFNSLSIKTFTMLGNLSKREKLNLYFLIGAGLFMDKTTEASTTATTFDGSGFRSHFGMDFGIGTSYKISKSTSIFIEPRYSGTFEKKPSLFISVKAGVMFAM